MTLFVPKALYSNEVTKVLDEIRHSYGMLTREGYIFGLRERGIFKAGLYLFMDDLLSNLRV